MGSLLVYGSYGYTGRLVAHEAVSSGSNSSGCSGESREGALTVTVAGRDDASVARQADALGVEGRSFALADGNEDEDEDGNGTDLESHLEDIDAVLNCAGPFVETVDPLIEACLETGTDYLDVTGEVAVFERLRQRDARAREAEITMLPGVGFEVVPSDCLAAMLGERLPGADDLALGVKATTTPSRGTARTVLSLLGDGGIVRRNGRLIEVPAAFRTRQIDFGDGPENAVSVPWGDVVTAAHSTGIESIEVYAAAPPWATRALSTLDSLSWLLECEPVERTLERGIDALIDGPDEQALEDGAAVVWGEAIADDGRSVRARLRTPNPYALTADAAVTAAERVLGETSDGQDRVPPGFQTPASAFGAEFALELEGVEREVLEMPSEADDDGTAATVGPLEERSD